MSPDAQSFMWKLEDRKISFCNYERFCTLTRFKPIVRIVQLGNGLFSHYRLSELYRDVFLNLALSALKSTDFTTKLSLNRTSHIKLIVIDFTAPTL